MPRYALKVNGKPQTVDADADTPLLYVLRDNLALHGPKYGCGLGQCGACTVHVNGEPARSCLLPITSAQGKNVTTLEGLTVNGSAFKMAAKDSKAAAKEDFPLPDGPVIAIIFPRGISTSIFLRLCVRAPRTMIFCSPFGSCHFTVVFFAGMYEC